MYYLNTCWSLDLSLWIFLGTLIQSRALRITLFTWNFFSTYYAILMSMSPLLQTALIDIQQHWLAHFLLPWSRPGQSESFKNKTYRESSKTLNYETPIHHFESGGLAKRSSSSGDSEQRSGLFDETVCPVELSVVVAASIGSYIAAL